MTAASAIRLALWSWCAVVALVLPASGQAQNRPITIPPATQITPPALPPAAPAAALPTVQGIPPAPHTVLPASVETVRDPLGAGIVMYGQLTGKADSALAVISSIFTYSGAFDPIPAPLLAVADKNDRSAQTLFAATVHGATVLGIAVVALDDTGGNVSVFYDYAEFLPRVVSPAAASTGTGGHQHRTDPTAAGRWQPNQRRARLARDRTRQGCGRTGRRPGRVDDSWRYDPGL